MVNKMIEGRYTVDPDRGCYVWTGPIQSGYGIVQVDGKSKRAHRVNYERIRGPVPKGLVLDHLCRNRACINPWHLEAVTLKVNSLRGSTPIALNAFKTECPKGHQYTIENTAFCRGGRVCITCRRELGRKNMAAYRARKRLNAVLSPQEDDPLRERLARITEHRATLSPEEYPEDQPSPISPQEGE